VEVKFCFWSTSSESTKIKTVKSPLLLQLSTSEECSRVEILPRMAMYGCCNSGCLDHDADGVRREILGSIDMLACYSEMVSCGWMVL